MIAPGPLMTHYWITKFRKISMYYHSPYLAQHIGLIPKGKKGAVTWLRSGGCRLLLGHMEDQPITHPGLKALRSATC